VDVRGKYLIPGLWDMHIHPKHSPEVFYPLLIANGVTGIRDAGTPVPLATVLQWRQEVAAGKRVGPRHIVTGRYVDKRDDGFSFKVTTPAEARRVVDTLQATGADFIKVHVVSPAVYFAIAAEARRIGISFGGHVPSDSRPLIPLIEASDSGATIIDHSHNMRNEGRCMGDSATLERCAPVAERFRRNGTWVVPTLLVHTVLGGRRVLSDALRANALRYWPDSMVRRPSAKDSGRAVSSSKPPVRSDSVQPSDRLDIMQQVGMPMLAGTDASPSNAPLWGDLPTFTEFVPGFSLHEELATMVWAGLTPLAALQAATLNPAKALHATESLGTVAPGKLADLVLLDANPLVDITNAMKIQAVVANGRYFDRAALDAMLAEVARTARGP
jgi:hypothetical protein